MYRGTIKRAGSRDPERFKGTGKGSPEAVGPYASYVRNVTLSVLSECKRLGGYYRFDRSRRDASNVPRRIDACLVHVSRVAPVKRETPRFLESHSTEIRSRVYHVRTGEAHPEPRRGTRSLASRSPEPTNQRVLSHTHRSDKSPNPRINARIVRAFVFEISPMTRETNDSQNRCVFEAFVHPARGFGGHPLEDAATKDLARG